MDGARLPENVEVQNTAFFFDLDGTLAPLAETPDAVMLAPRIVHLLQAIAAQNGGGIAVVSGRSLMDIDRLLASLYPLCPPAAGLHGAEWRDASGRTQRIATDAERVAGMASALQGLVRRHPGLLLECKGIAVAVHYRNAPQHEATVHDAMAALAERHSDAFVLQPGKMVFEIKPLGANKGLAIRRLMQAAPFAQRIACFAGDDLTDEAGFNAVNEMQGLSIKVGPGPTLAQYRVPSVDALADWLASLLAPQSGRST